MNDKVIGIITQKDRGVDDSLMVVANRDFKEWERVGVTEPSLSGEDNTSPSPHPKKNFG